MSESIDNRITITLEELADYATSIIYHSNGPSHSAPCLFIYEDKLYFSTNSTTHGKSGLLHTYPDKCEVIDVSELVESALIISQVAFLSDIEEDEEAKYRFYVNFNNMLIRYLKGFDVYVKGA